MWEKYKELIQKNKKIEEDWYILGIDLGTTHSVVSYFNSVQKRPEPIDMSLGFGKIPMPSVVQLRREDGREEWVVGEEALRAMLIYPGDTVQSVKRLMGSDTTVMIGGKSYTPEAVSAMILKALLGHVESLNPKMVLAGVVVSVPYDFDDAAKKATMAACRSAGLSDSLICLIEEPKAAALAYSFHNPMKEKEKIMVFDFGGGTLDITVFEVARCDERQIRLEVLSEGGDACHGGDGVDEILYGHLVRMLAEQTGTDAGALTLEQKVELMWRAREVKERLSGVQKFKVPFNFCFPPFMKEVTRVQMEELIAAFIEKTKGLVLKTLQEGYKGAIHPQDIDKVLMEGGSSAMPWVKEMLIQVFNDTDKLYASQRPALDISIGATYYAVMKLGLLEHPDMMAMGRQIRFEVTVPHDIGFEVDYGSRKDFFSMISRGTPYLLADKSQEFTLRGETQADMTTLTLKILERMRRTDKIEDCRLIGEVDISGLPMRPSGKTRLKVSLKVAEEGGMVSGAVEDLGYMAQFEKSNFKADFTPVRGEVTRLKA